MSKNNYYYYYIIIIHYYILLLLCVCASMYDFSDITSRQHFLYVISIYLYIRETENKINAKRALTHTQIKREQKHCY